MKPFLSRIGLPLLAKELMEQAARRRTYIVRVLYAVLLFAGAFLCFWEILDVRSRSAFAVLGRGREMFEALIGLQFAGVYLFMPAMTCGALTLEKERKSLELLFLTRLGPWAILLEKLLGRLLPMLTFLLLSLPLLAFTYGMGGVSTDYLWAGVWCLFISAVQVGTLALMCSAFFASTVGAFMASYVFGFLLFFTLPFLHEMRFIDLDFYAGMLSYMLGSPPSRGVRLIDDEDLAFAFFGLYHFVESHQGGGRSLVSLVLRTLPILASSVGFLALARVFLVRRAFVPPRNFLLKFFRFLDGLFSRWNDRLAGGVVLVHETTRLPGDEPIAWRETTKKSLGTTRYLFRVLVALEFPTAFVCVLMLTAGGSARLEPVNFMVFLLWTIALLIVAVHSASLVAGERSHQTLDVLLTTPLRGREIIRQKMRGVRRLMAVLWVPFLTVFALETWWIVEFPDLTSYRRGEIPAPALLYALCSLLSVLIYLPMVSWLAFLIGLRVRSQARAILASVVVVAVWCALFFGWLVAYEILDDFWMSRRPPLAFVFLMLTSPATIVLGNEFNIYHEFDTAWGLVLANFAFYGCVLYGLRWLCLNNADRYLGRGGSEHDAPEPRESAPVSEVRALVGPT